MAVIDSKLIIPIFFCKHFKSIYNLRESFAEYLRVLTYGI